MARKFWRFPALKGYGFICADGVALKGNGFIRADGVALKGHGFSRATKQRYGIPGFSPRVLHDPYSGEGHGLQPVHLTPPPTAVILSEGRHGNRSRRTCSCLLRLPQLPFLRPAILLLASLLIAPLPAQELTLHVDVKLDRPERCHCGRAFARGLCHRRRR